MPPITEDDSSSPAAMKSLRSALRVLMEFTSGSASYTVTELAAQTGLSKSHISKIAAALADARLIRQDPSSQAYSVAVRSFILGSQFFNQDELCSQALPLLRDLTERTGHSTRLSALDGDRAAYLIGINGPLFTDSPWKIGTYMPIHSTSAGRILLAFMDEQDVLAIIQQPLRKVTPETVVDPSALVKLLHTVRDKGFSVSRDENTLGLAAISVPVFDEHRVVIGALSIAFPSHTVAKKEEAELLVPLQRTARTLSQRMGCPVYPYGGAR
ncbi:IclR family transcriptional regulator [Caballeronia sp. LZ035]|uniref:IclR family transcriptional regulator n=1 Tax=Caballeronia sp. LZ035 TaxID=3038568 RepID=UPI0028642B99|nr:IclR family transcriptional regulator [Caballeronia sp. LZ035]MDR5760707.1 IclR family transcriptional regulator [Caballeronia sp. LZ035]